jgi:hypothetical protein
VEKCGNESGPSDRYWQQAPLLYFVTQPPPLGRVIPDASLALATALQMIATGAIQDGKTIMLLQQAALVGFEELRARSRGSSVSVCL